MEILNVHNKISNCHQENKSQLFTQMAFHDFIFTFETNNSKLRKKDVIISIAL